MDPESLSEGVKRFLCVFLDFLLMRGERNEIPYTELKLKVDTYHFCTFQKVNIAVTKL